MGASMAAHLAARSAACSVASMDVMSAAQLDTCWAESKADLKDTTLAVLLVIASVVWTEEMMVAWLVSCWAGSTVGQMDEC